MPKNEDGEFELTLGNRQLLSMFFVVVVLLAVFFVMGYIVGRNSAPSPEPSIARKTDTKPPVVDTPAATTATTPAPTSPAAEPSRPLETAVEKPAEAKPEPPKPEPTKAVTSKSEPAAKHETKAEKAAEKAAEKTQKAERPTPSNVPVAGQTYLQLSATSKHDADAYVEVLRKNSFPSIDVEVPGKPGTYRVLVGPLAPGEINKMKTDLQAKGLPGNAAFPQHF